MSESSDPSAPSPVTTACESPPPAPAPARETASDELAAQLRRMAQQLMRSQNRRLIVEYLQLRRALR